MANGPGNDWQIAMASRICSLVSHLRSSTSSRSIWPTSATGPPKPRKPSRKKYLTNSPRCPCGIVLDVVMSRPTNEESSAELISLVTISWCLENTFDGQTQPGRLHLNEVSREGHFVTTIVRFL